MPDLSVWLAPAVALLAAVIAAAQWHTARSKLVLDLFNQRLEVYQSISAVLGNVMRHGTATTDDVIQLAGPQDKANFLFGDDVNDYLIRLRKDLAHLGYCRTIIAQLKGDEQYHKAVEAQHKIMVETVGKFHEEFGALLRPYMKMHHKKPLW